MNRRDVLKAAASGVAAMSFASPAISESIGGRSFDNKRTALIFIEFQNQWLDSASPLNALMQDRALFSAAVENSARVLRKARERQANVVHAGLSLVADPDYLIFAGGKDKPGLRGAIPTAGTWRSPDQVAFPAPFSPQTGEFVVAGQALSPTRILTPICATTESSTFTCWVLHCMCASSPPCVMLMTLVTT